MEKVPSGFGAPRNPHVLAHGVLHSGWQPNLERTVLFPQWLQVDCCLRWPAHNESYINGLCGHCIHGGCLLTLHLRFSCHSLRKGRSVSFTSYLYYVNTGNRVPFRLCSVFFSTLFHCLWMLVISLPFFKQSVKPSSTWACLILVRWSERGWRAFSHKASMSKTCRKSRIYLWCSTRRCFLYYSGCNSIVMFLYKIFLSQFDIRHSFSLSIYF